MIKFIIFYHLNFIQVTREVCVLVLCLFKYDDCFEMMCKNSKLRVLNIENKVRLGLLCLWRKKKRMRVWY